MLVITKFFGLPLLILVALVLGLTFWNLDIIDEARQTALVKEKIKGRCFFQS